MGKNKKRKRFEHLSVESAVEEALDFEREKCLKTMRQSQRENGSYMRIPTGILDVLLVRSFFIGGRDKEMLSGHIGFQGSSSSASYQDDP